MSPLSPRLLILLAVILALFEACSNLFAVRDLYYISDDVYSTEIETYSPLTTKLNRKKKKKEVVIGYAVSVTQFAMPNRNKAEFKLLDRAAVLAKSIKLAMDKSLIYDYHLYAFVHPNATDCIPIMTALGYRVQVRDTPFNITAIQNLDLIAAQGNGCCGEREYLKLYSYLLLEYPVVVHLDLDSIVLRPMEDVFNLMTGRMIKKYDKERFAQTSTMWLNNNNNNTLTIPWSSVIQKSTSASTSAFLLSKNILNEPDRINFMFTRDYNMVDPPSKKVYQMGVQGGFLVVRPNRRDFDRMVDIIVSGGHGFSRDGWGGHELAYGGYYGAGTIQGLSSFYYDHYENSTRSVELNRCTYNTMVDNRYHFNEKNKTNLCRTTEEKCENCRATKFEQIYTAHFTVCGKPEWCRTWRPEESDEGRLCLKLFEEWHKVRLSLEIDWMERFERYVPKLNGVDPDESRRYFLESTLMGHCDGRKYIPLRFPNLDDNRSVTLIQ